VIRPHLGASRKIHPGQKIHGSFFLGDIPYTPKARPFEDDVEFWETLRSKRFSSDLVELELYEKTRLVMESFNDEPAYAVDSLHRIATSSKPPFPFFLSQRLIGFRRRSTSSVQQGHLCSGEVRQAF